MRRRGAQTSRPRAKRASSSCSSRLFERSERSSRSELRDGPRSRAPQGTPPEGWVVACEALPTTRPRPQPNARTRERVKVGHAPSADTEVLCNRLHIAINRFPSRPWQPRPGPWPARPRA
jgi:hypothetical protein